MRAAAIGIWLIGAGCLTGASTTEGTSESPPPTSEPCEPAFADLDEDGFGDRSQPLCVGDETAVPNDGDCDDGDPSVYPGAPRRCGGIDDDCDPRTPSPVALLGDRAFDTLEEAVAAAAFDEVVDVCTGEHVVQTVEVPHTVTVRSQVQDRAAVVLHGTGEGPLFQLSDSQAMLTLQHLTLTGGQGEQGGVVSGANPEGPELWGTVALMDVIARKNSAQNGGVVAASTVALQDSLLEHNDADQTFGYGGAILAVQVDVLGSTFASNDAFRGGAIYAYGGLNSSDSIFDDNSATDAGGAAFADGGVYSTNDLFDDNEADDGGAVMVLAPSTFDDVDFLGNRAIHEGGALLASSLSGTTEDELDLTRSTFDGNIATVGGGLYVEGFGTVQAELTTWTNNQADDPNLLAAWGGAAAVVVDSAGGTQWTGGLLQSNQTAGKGGGLHVFCETANLPMTLSGVNFEGGTATYGGGLYVIGACDMSLSSCVFDGNEAEVHGGGMVLGLDALADLSNVSFTDNTSEVGSALLMASRTEVWMWSGSVTNNQSGRNSAAIHMSTSPGAAGDLSLSYTDFGKLGTANDPYSLAQGFPSEFSKATYVLQFQGSTTITCDAIGCGGSNP
ncbi:MAG: putative metal-binding motif-containing protein [Myxococcales bacterium]|nr:putative metal-binding motif-containing protein [Myxococcales bacterium]